MTSMRTIVAIDPFRCRLWQSHDRLEETITQASCETELGSFQQHGQFVPVLGRPVSDDPSCDVELICGARRLFVARKLRKELMVEVRVLTDQEAIIAMDMENRQRKDVSPYERGLSYLRWLRGNHFKSQEELARTLQVCPSRVSRLLKLARLPSVIIDAFESPLEIREAWGADIADGLENPERNRAILQAARAIRAMERRPEAAEVYRRLLLACGKGRKPRATAHDTVVTGRDGSPLFRIRHQRNSVAVLLSVDRTSSSALSEIKRAVADILEGT
jgi:ParB family transcriptional regulator, chromosome partitioning protein